MPTHHPPPILPVALEPAMGPRADGSVEDGGSRSTDIRGDYNRGRGGILLPLALGAIGFAAIHPFDLALFERVNGLGARTGGDLKRELFAWQQYGQGLALVVTALLIWMLDRARRRRLLDLGLAALLAQVVSMGGKMLIGRPRPRAELMDPSSFPGPLGLYPIQRDGQWVLVHGWDRAAGGGASTDVWSMPSSHTLFAVMLSVFLATLYPRARWVFWVLAAMVGVCRVLFGAHWPSDVVVGAAAGFAIGAVVVRRGLGVRALDWVWIRWVDRGAVAAWRGNEG